MSLLLHEIRRLKSAGARTKFANARCGWQLGLPATSDTLDPAQLMRQSFGLSRAPKP